MGVNKPLLINQSSDRIGGGGCWRDPTTRRNCVTKGEGAAGGETKDEIRRRGGGGGGMPTGINCSMVVIVNDGLWISSINVIHNVDH